MADTSRHSEEAPYAAGAAAERAMVDPPASADWDRVLNGASPSSFIDGPPTGVRRFAGGTTIDLTGLTHSANCGHASACTSSEMSVSTVDRPWGSNNPVWRPYAYGPAETLAPEDTGRSSFYVVVWVGDDQSETDGDPQHDGQDPLTNPGSGVIALRVEAFGPQNARKALHLTLQRGNGKVRVISWRSLR